MSVLEHAAQTAVSSSHSEKNNNLFDNCNINIFVYVVPLNSCVTAGIAISGSG